MPPEEREKPGLLTATTAALLAGAELEVVGRLAYSSNGTFLVRCQHDEGHVAAVYKPAAGERPLWDFPSDTLYRREVAAFDLSHWLGWDLVPVTVARADGPLGPGSIQLFIDHDPEEHYFTLLDRHRRAFRRLAFFDMLTNNADRKGGHCLADGDGRVWAIDHGLTFHVEPKLRTVIWDFAGQKLPAPERRAAARLALELADHASSIARAMAQNLSAEEVSGLAQRAAALASEGVYPDPTSTWAFPWPLV